MMTMTMVGRLSECVLLSYRTPAASVAHHLPAGLELVTRGPWAFWNVVLCRVEQMRPAGVPAALGVSYEHVAYRLLVQAMTRSADVRRGLFFVHSDANAPLLGAVGNKLSDFRFHPATILQHHDDASHTLRYTVRNTAGRATDARVEIDTTPAAAGMPADSCFPTLADARAFLRYAPLGLSVEGGWLKLAEVMRDEGRWAESVVGVRRAAWSFFETHGQTDAALELATRVAPIDYRWRLGRREPLLVPPAGAGAARQATPEIAAVA